MMVRFLADADLKGTIVRGVLRREPLMDFMTAQAARLSGLIESEVLSLAAIWFHTMWEQCPRTFERSGTRESKRRFDSDSAEPRYRDGNRGASADLALARQPPPPESRSFR